MTIPFSSSYPVTSNDPALTERAVPVLRSVAGAENVEEVPLETGAEDFSFFARVVPGFYFFLGVVPPGENGQLPPSNHSPKFFIDESTLKVGLEALSTVTLDYLARASGQPIAGM